MPTEPTLRRHQFFVVSSGLICVWGLISLYEVERLVADSYAAASQPETPRACESGARMATERRPNGDRVVKATRGVARC
jgi:hypothetical protein